MNLMNPYDDGDDFLEPIAEPTVIGLTLFAEGEFHDRDVPWPGPIGRVFYDEGAE